MATSNLMLMILLISYFIGILGEKISDHDKLEGEDGYYENETPSYFVDLCFIVFMVIHHSYYAYKFTDYSLSHIHSTVDEKQQKKAEKQEKKSKKDSKKRKINKQVNNANTNTSELDAAFEKQKRRTSKAKAKAEKQMKKAVVKKNFTTKSSTTTANKRSSNNTVCCCIHCAPRYLTWHRTAIIRLFFRIYTSISCLLAMVLFMEFFMNLFVEFFITCIVHYDQGYIISLLLLPLMIYVIETLIRLSWHSVYVSWQINCDANGDFESVESDGTHHFNLQGDRFLFSYKMDSGDIEDEYIYSEASSSQSESSQSESESESDHNSVLSFKNIPSSSHKNSVPQTPTSPVSELAIIEEEETDLLVNLVVENKKKKRSASDVDKLRETMTENNNKFVIVDDEYEKKAVQKKKQRAMTEDNVTIRIKENDKIKKEKQRQKTLRRKEREELKLKLQEEKQQARQRRKKMKKEQREQMGDYFIATCWRAWFFLGTLFAACVASYSINIEFAINAFFWQLVMRYCIIGGFIWSLIYLLFAFILCFMSRMLSWKLLHPHISRCKFFCLIDAKDHEKKNKTWRNCKVLTMMSSIIFFIAFMAFGLYLDYLGNDAAGFAVFVALIWIAYYFTNLFMSCKPMGLIALWTDTIPPPGKNFFAHLQVSEQLEHAGHLNNTLRLSNMDSQTVRIKTNLELTRFNSDRSEQKPHKQSHKLSTDDIDSLSIATGVSAYVPNIEKLNVTKSHQTFAEERVAALLNRYRKFKYIYKEPKNKDGSKIKRRCGCKYWYLKIKLFWNNYKNYWLNVYRPFDEYDMETNLSATNILNGLQWIKPCLECKCFKKKSTKGKCGKCCTYLMDNTCNICLIFFAAAIIGILFFFASQFGINTDSNTHKILSMSVNNNSVIQNYPVCSEYFGAGSKLNSHDTDLSVLDVLFLSQVVYEMDNFNITEIIDIYFDSEYEIISSSYQVPFYFHIQHKYVDIDYVSIRGTAGLQEALQDISLFVEIGLFEGLQWLVPFLNALPTSFVTSMIYYASLTEQLINADVRDGFDEPIYHYLANYLENTTTLHLYIVGHSLGGGIAQIVAANLFEDGYDSAITSFGVCSPGVLYSSAKFGFGVEALDKTSRSLLPRRDLVSKVDKHGGSIQYTNCKETSMLNCHVMPSVICEVYNNCPNKLANKPQIFDCFCNNNDTRGQQFGYCLNATICEGDGCI